MSASFRQGDENSLAGYLHHYDPAGTDWRQFKISGKYSDLHHRPYFYLIKVDDSICAAHATIKIGISSNSNPQARLEEYALFYNNRFKVVLILTFSKWKKGKNSGYMQYMGARPLQERFETELKRRIRPIIDRGAEWLKPSKQPQVLSEILEKCKIRLVAN